jgi:hypothetical protein
VTCDQYAAKGFHERAQEQDKLLEQHGIDGIAAGDALIAQLTAVCGLDHALRPDGKAGRNGIVAIDAVVDWEQVKRATAQPRRDP